MGMSAVQDVCVCAGGGGGGGGWGGGVRAFCFRPYFLAQFVML